MGFEIRPTGLPTPHYHLPHYRKIKQLNISPNPNTMIWGWGSTGSALPAKQKGAEMLRKEGSDDSAVRSRGSRENQF